MNATVDQRRVYLHNNAPIGRGPVIYWMSRDQRVHDNWALLYAQQLAREQAKKIHVVFCLQPSFLGATIRQYDFLLSGLMQVEQELAKLSIPFIVLLGSPSEQLLKYASDVAAGVVITDFSPLRIKNDWVKTISETLSCAFIEVDAHNIVPCRVISHKQEYGAYTIRPKIHKALHEYLTEFPRMEPQASISSHNPVDWKQVRATLTIDETVPIVDWCKPGEEAARDVLKHFIATGLSRYNTERNDPVKDGQSQLSPYLHFGQISAQRIALAVEQSSVSQSEKDAFLEELIVRRELADNFCLHNPHYDSVQGFPNWAKQTLMEHADDTREFLYSSAELEAAETHDELWNAAQRQMVVTGKMHGYMRMYWAKKILEWTTSAQDALAIAIYLNDKYELDGRDPNGYAGIAWSIGGVHDRAWFTRPIFGKIRYMSYNGCRSKFAVDEYIKNN